MNTPTLKYATILITIFCCLAGVTTIKAKEKSKGSLGEPASAKCPEKAYPEWKKGAIAEVKRNLQTAITHYEEAMNKCPKHIKFQRSYHGAKQKLARLGMGKPIKNPECANDKEVKDLYTKGRIAHAKRRLQQALDYLDQATTKCPGWFALKSERQNVVDKLERLKNKYNPEETTD